MRLTILGVAVLATASALGEGYITSVRLPDGTTKTFQDEGARQEIQDILSQKYLKPESVKAGDNVSVTTNAEGEVTISAVTGTESDFTTNNTVLVTTIETVAPEPGDYSTVSNAAVNALSRSEAEAGFTEWDFSHAPTLITDNPELKWDVQRGRWDLYLNGEPQTDFPGSIDDVRVNLGGSEYATRTRLPTMADATLTPSAFSSKWTVSPGYDGEWRVKLNETMGIWVCGTPLEESAAYAFPDLSGGYVTDENVTVLYGNLPGSQDIYTFTRQVTGYTLGSQTNKVLQPAGDYAPATNILKSALSSDVQASLGNADTAVQPADIDSTLSVQGDAADAKATGDALAARPTKAQIDEGWWSEWEVEPDDGAITSIERIADGPETYIWVAHNSDGFWTDEDNQSDENATHLEFNSGEKIYTATRHRVGAPVPTKPEDIGAVSTNDVQITPVYSDTPTFSEWTTEPAGYESGIVWESGLWCIPGTDNAEMPNAADINATSLVFEGSVKITATRTRTDIIGYTLGVQTNSVLAATNLLASIAPDYSTISNKAVNAVSDSLVAATNTFPVIDLISSYGIACGESNDVDRISFKGCIATNRFKMVYDTTAASSNCWIWTLYSGNSTNVLESGTVEGFSPITDKSVTISFETSVADIYSTSNITFETGRSSKTRSGLVRTKDLTPIVYDDETDWMSLYFRGQPAKFYPNSNQVEKIVSDATPTNISQLVNDSGYVTIGELNYEVVSNAAVHALSRAEAEAGFTEWKISDDTVPNTLVRQPWVSNGYWQVEYSSYDVTETMPSDEPASATDTVISMSGGTWHIERTRLPTMADLDSKASTNEVQLTPVYGGNGDEFSIAGLPSGAVMTYGPTWGIGAGWEIGFSYEGRQYYGFNIVAEDALPTSITCEGSTTGPEDPQPEDIIVILSRNQILGYVLGSQTNSVVAATNGLLRADYDDLVSNVAFTNAVNAVLPSITNTYDFSTNVGLYTAVRDMIQALGGSVTNFPTLTNEQ